MIWIRTWLVCSIIIRDKVCGCLFRWDVGGVPCSIFFLCCSYLDQECAKSLAVQRLRNAAEAAFCSMFNMDHLER